MFYSLTLKQSFKCAKHKIDLRIEKNLDFNLGTFGVTFGITFAITFDTSPCASYTPSVWSASPLVWNDALVCELYTEGDTNKSPLVHWFVKAKKSFYIPLVWSIGLLTFLVVQYEVLYCNLCNLCTLCTGGASPYTLYETWHQRWYRRCTRCEV